MFDGKFKAVTFSFDDGVTQDKRLVELFDKYGLKCTFNINSGKLGEVSSFERNDVMVSHNKINKEEVKELYKNHEVAVHTVNHLKMTECTKEVNIKEIEDDKKALEELVGYEIKGMAYPFGGADYLTKVAPTVKETSMLYARSTVQSFDFEPQSDLISFKPTIHLFDFDKLYKLANEFVDMKAEKEQIFYIWGHSYEFDMYDTWEKLEEFLKFISNRQDIFYGTNSQVLL